MVARASLLLVALFYLGFGAALLASPQLLDITGVAITRPGGAVELRAFYGGLEVGLAGFFLVAVRRPEWHRPALLVQVATLGGVVGGRIVGLLLARGEIGPLLFAFLALEAAGLLLGLVALRSLRARPARAT